MLLSLGTTLIYFDFWSRLRKIRIGGLLQGTHLMRDAAWPTHMVREDWKPLQKPKRDSVWHRHLAGRVLVFSLQPLPLWECDTEGRGGGRGRTHLRGGVGGVPA